MRFLKRTRAGEILPLGYRTVYWDVRRNESVSAPVGLHWLVRAVYLAWAFTYRWRPSRWENALADARESGEDQGFRKGFEQGVAVGEALTVQQIAENARRAEQALIEVGRKLGIREEV